MMSASKDLVLSVAFNQTTDTKKDLVTQRICFHIEIVKARLLVERDDA
jgi:hypothetical protein